MNKSTPICLAAAALLAIAMTQAQTHAAAPSGAVSQISASTAMANNDLNKDGVITKAEATKAGSELSRAWDQYDVNKDGKVDTAELTKGLAAVQGSRQVTVDTAMANNDLNKDGVITKAEATKAGGELSRAWDQYDVNKDAKVDTNELTKGLAAAQGAGQGASPAAIPRAVGAGVSAPVKK